MEPSGSESGGGTGTPVELVVLNGRQRGSRKPLGGPATLVGRAEGCEIRLNVEGVEPFHCVIARGPNEVTIRDLDSALGTFVNGQRIRSVRLRDGDLLDVGPFRFRVLLPPAKPIENPPAANDGIRIQIAAVVAQQIAVDERERQLEEQRLALEQQRAQLDADLGEQQRRLAEAAEHHEADKRAWALEQAEARRQADQREADLKRERQAVREDRTRLAGERARLEERAAGLNRIQSELRSREADLAICQVRFNTERELDSRVLQHGMQQLAEDQKRWHIRRNRERAALQVRRLQVVEGERKLAEARALLLREKHAWEEQQRLLETELYGLHARIGHERQKLHKTPVPVAQILAPLSPHPSEGPHVARFERVVDLDRLAGELADQRQHLVEQWDRLARAQLAWQAERDEAATALETLTHRFAQQEDALTHREKEAESTDARLQEWRDQLEQIRRETALAQARAQAERQTWEAERDLTVGNARQLSELARRQLDALSEVRKKWNRKRRVESTSLRTERRAIAHLLQGLARARLNLACDDQVAGLQQDLDVVEGLLDELTQKIERLACAQNELNERETALDERETLIAANQARLDQARQDAEGRRRHAERRLAVVEEESEHLARALLPDTEPPMEPLERAA